MKNVCRTCLRAPQVLQKLNADLINKIEVIAPIQLTENNDAYPETICNECIENITKFHSFRQTIIESDNEIRARYLTQSPPPHNLLDFSDNKIKIEPVSIKTEKNATVHTLHLKRAKHMHTPRNAKCQICKVSFTSREQLIKHNRHLHVKRGICNICGLELRIDNMGRHVRLHSEMPVECTECNKLFKNSESLRGHMLIHKDTLFKCDLCGKTTKIKAEHKRHIALHTNPDLKKASCKICGKKVSDMKVHMHSHTGERPHICEHCGKGFTSNYSLRVHIRQHTKEKPFQCEFCPSAFPQKVSLTAHLKSRHNVLS